MDFTARAVAALGDGARAGFHTFNVVNPHEDGISLDTFVDRLTAAGHPISRVDDYDEWLDRFETALRALPDHQRRHSLLPLLHAFTLPERPLPGSAPAEATGLTKSRSGATLWDATPMLTALGHTASTGALTVTTAQQLAAFAGHDLAGS
ncbi:hypothetical protein AB0A77_24625 [Streptomyces varsoviensis]|uniref:hypothetical protein n=1 Tax=Streptomyces varsoviensis TaxID=67373 RepID=UPI0033CCD3C6